MNPHATKQARIRSVLVPTDLTSSSDRALRRLALLPLANDARVTLLHVVPASLHRSQQRTARRDAEQALAEDANDLRESLAKKIRIEPVVKIGAVAEEIAALARKVKAELVVMGRGGRRPLRDTFLGSTAERVVRSGQLPVLVVRLRPRAGYTRPALALDQDQAALEVVRMLLLVLPPPRPVVEVLHAFDVPFRGLIYPSLTEDEAKRAKDQLRLDATREIGALLDQAVAESELAPHEVPSWKTHVSCGSPRIVVEKAIAKSDSDLLALGTNAHAGAAYVFLGTVAGDILREAKCDVLMVPPACR